jgi:hypothetical protein
LKFGKFSKQEDDIAYWEEWFSIFESIERPTTFEEAEALLVLFYDFEDEDANGGAETVITVIESCPDFYFKKHPDFNNAWHQRMWEPQLRSFPRETSKFLN